MKFHESWRASAAALAALVTCVSTSADALVISRLTPPSELFATGNLTPIISRFVVGQRFDLQATVQPDAGQTITSVGFLVDGAPVAGTVSLTPATVAGLAANTVVVKPLGNAGAARTCGTQARPRVIAIPANRFGKPCVSGSRAISSTTACVPASITLM